MGVARQRRWLPIVIVAVGLGVFFGLAAGCRLLFNQTENRLLRQRTREASVALQVSISQISAPLDVTAKVAEATDGDPSAFAAVAPKVGNGNGVFRSFALYRIGTNTPVAQLGVPIDLPLDGANGVNTMLGQAARGKLVVVDLVGDADSRLGYAVASALKNPHFVVYGERIVSPDPVRRNTGEAFAQLNYAIYLGAEPTPDHLLATSLTDLPIGARHADEVIPFGNNHLLLSMTPIGHLSGDLFANLWWIVAAGGVLVSLAFGVLTQRLLARRDMALDLARDNERLYDEQRHIAETLQLGLLPQHLSAPENIEMAARYWPAGSANLIGGDFYDVFKIDANRWAAAIGDVCGKGIEAAALTGLARHTLRTAARHSTSPADVLLAVHDALSDHQPPTFCTACFAYITPSADGSHRVELSLGGHPQPLLRHHTGRVEAVGTEGMLLGMIEPTVHSTVLQVVPGDTLVFYTDGLTDAPGEQAVSIDELATLLELDGEQPVEQLADAIRALKRSRRPLGSGDDTALLILRFGGQLRFTANGEVDADRRSEPSKPSAGVASGYPPEAAGP